MPNTARHASRTRQPSTCNQWYQEMCQIPLGKTSLLISLLTRPMTIYWLQIPLANTHLHTRFIRRQQKHSQVNSPIFKNGAPNTISTDNGPPFNREPFTKFLIEQRVDHITSSLHYPKSNGFIERQVKTMKTALATAAASRKTLDDILLSLRSTPIGPNLP